jgi:hypothetical protein
VLFKYSTCLKSYLSGTGNARNVSEADISVNFLLFVIVDETVFAKLACFRNILFLEVHHVSKI